MRHRLLTALFDLTAAPYAALKRSRVPWDLTPTELLAFPEGSLGRTLGADLMAKGFTLMPRLEVHDVCHLLTGVAVDVPGEIALQFLLFGNGKRSPYLFGVLFLGSLLFPERMRDFLAAWRQGRALERFFDVDYRPLLARPLEEVRPAARAGRSVVGALPDGAIAPSVVIRPAPDGPCLPGAPRATAAAARAA